MIRRQLAVASPIAPKSLARGFVDALRKPPATMERARALLAREFSAKRAILVDSGTSALVLALRVTVPRGGVVAMPAYACVDLVAAALYAGVRLRLYDIDPATLSPDLDSVKSVLATGIDAIVVAHLFGYAADVPGVRQLAAEQGIPVIEDAAQGAGGRLAGARLGTFGDLVVLSFGRGKGLCAGGGGALLVNDSPTDDKFSDFHEHAGRGIGGLVNTGVQWMLGRPSLYALPASIPWLHLGEMIYHPAQEPTGLSFASASMLPAALALEANDVQVRRRNAQRLGEMIAAVDGLRAAIPISSSDPGYLRFALRDLRGALRPDAHLGIVKPYPGTVADYPESRPILAPGPSVPGAAELARCLLALPTHRFFSARDLEMTRRWMSALPISTAIRHESAP